MRLRAHHFRLSFCGIPGAPGVDTTSLHDRVDFPPHRHRNHWMKRLFRFLETIFHRRLPFPLAAMFKACEVMLF